MERRLPDPIAAAEPANADIRRAANRLYQSNLLPLILVYGVSVLLAGVPNALFANLPAPWPVLVNWAFTTVLYPVTAIGAARVMLSVWNGEKPAFSQLFWCLDNPKLFLRALGYGLFFRSIMTLATLFYGTFGNDASAGLLKVISTLVYLASYVFTIRAAVTPYQLASDETSRLFPALRHSLQKTKGKFWRYVWLALSVYWIMFLIIATCAAVMIGAQQQVQQSTVNTALLLPSMLANIAVGPLLQLTIAGLLRTMLPHAQKTSPFDMLSGGEDDPTDDDDCDDDPGNGDLEPAGASDSACGSGDDGNQKADADKDIRWG